VRLVPAVRRLEVGTQVCAAREIRGMQKSELEAVAPGCPRKALRVKAVAGSVRS